MLTCACLWTRHDLINPPFLLPAFLHTRPQHPPIEGNAFLASLMEAKPVCSVDPYTGATQVINPAAIASAVLSTREVLAKQLAKNLTSHVQDANVTLMRTHLETHTYVSGTNDEVKPSFRQYRSRKEQRHQLL